MFVGYARVSFGEQTLQQQIDALSQAGCAQIFSDEMSDAEFVQTNLYKAFEAVHVGDTLIVWRLDRLGYSLRDVLKKAAKLKQRQIDFKSLQEDIDTNTSDGEMLWRVFEALAECERNLIRERTNSGLRVARARGRLGGRRREMTQEKVQVAARLIKEPDITIKEICDILKVSKPTLYRYVGPDGEIRKW